MAKKQHKERIQQPKESQTASTLIKLFFLISFIVLGFFVFNDMPINWILGVYAVDITMFFYAFALWRVDQYTTQMQVTLFIGGIIIYYAVFNSTKTALKRE